MIWVLDTLVKISEEKQTIYVITVILKYCKMASVAGTPHLRVKNT